MSVKWKYETVQNYLTLEAICIWVSREFCISLLFVRTGHPENRGSKPYGWAKIFFFSTASSSLSTGFHEQNGYVVKLASHLRLLPQVKRKRVVCPFSRTSFKFRRTFIVFVVRYPRFGGIYMLDILRGPKHWLVSPSRSDLCSCVGPQVTKSCCSNLSDVTLLYGAICQMFNIDIFVPNLILFHKNRLERTDLRGDFKIRLHLICGL